MPQTLKIISLNIEKNKHLKEVLDFLNTESPDVICLQEIFRPDFETFKEILGFHGVFDGQVLLKNDAGESNEQGVCILSKYPIIKTWAPTYTNHHIKLGSVSMSHHSEKDVDKNRSNKQYSRNLLCAEIEAGGQVFTFTTTHFTWGYYGYVDKSTNEFIWQVDPISTGEQMADALRLLDIFKSIGQFVFCADTNCPRGQEVFTLLSNNLKDNIPEVYRTSIDGSLHRAGPLPLMVDCLFTTDTYKAHNVVLKDKISDHMAVVAEIEKI